MRAGGFRSLRRSIHPIVPVAQTGRGEGYPILFLLTDLSLMHRKFFNQLGNQLDARLWPEVCRFPDREIRKQAERRMFHTWYFYLIIFIVIPVIFNITQIAMIKVIWWLHPHVSLGVFLPLAFVGHIVGFPILVIMLYRPVARRQLRRDLNMVEIPTCVHCGYDLRGCVGDCCPECGVPTVRPATAQDLPAPKMLVPSLIGALIFFLIVTALCWRGLFYVGMLKSPVGLGG
jgi:hypothetical protein